MSVRRDISGTVEEIIDEIENSCRSFKFIFSFILLQIICGLNKNLKKRMCGIKWYIIRAKIKNKNLTC